jgi:hypothetical protein
MHVQDDDCLPGELPWSVALPADSGSTCPFSAARIDVLYRDAMEKLDEVDYEACIKYVVRKMLAWYTKFPPSPKNDWATAVIKAAVLGDNTPKTAWAVCKYYKI